LDTIDISEPVLLRFANSDNLFVVGPDGRFHPLMWGVDDYGTDVRLSGDEYRTELGVSFDHGYEAANGL
jgi:hypothetical protein